MRKKGKRRYVFSESITEAEVRLEVKRKEMTSKQFIEHVNKRRKTIGKQPIYPEGTVSIISTRNLFIPTAKQNQLINIMSNRVLKKGKYKSVSDLAKETGKSQASIYEHIRELRKKGFPVGMFFKEKVMGKMKKD